MSVLYGITPSSPETTLQFTIDKVGKVASHAAALGNPNNGTRALSDHQNVSQIRSLAFDVLR